MFKCLRLKNVTTILNQREYSENQKYMIGLDSYSRQGSNYLDPILFISVFESTAYLKFAKL